MIECKNLTNGLRIATAGTYFTCCHTFNYPYLDENGKEMLASTHTIEDAMKSPTRLKMLDDFKNDIRHPACKVCWDCEDSGFPSKRERDNETFKMNMHPILKDNDIFFLELNLGNTCNLACRICHISASSKWKKFHHITEPNVTEEKLNHYVDKYSKSFTDDSIVWTELEKILPTVKSLDIYGGEPMLMKKQWDILEKCVDMGYSKNQQMGFNTNGTIINDRYVKILTSFKHSRVGFSIDGVGPRFNYLRYYGEWDIVNENVNLWLEKTKNVPKYKLMFEVACTVSILNVLYIYEVADFVIKNGINLHVSFVHNPRHLHIGNIPNEYKNIIIEKLEIQKLEIRKRHNYNGEIAIPQERKNYINYILDEADKVIDTLKLYKTTEPAQWSNFMIQTHGLDKLRNESFAKTFPELAEIYKFETIY